MVNVVKNSKETFITFLPSSKSFKEDFEKIETEMNASKKEPFHSVFLIVPNQIKEIVASTLNKKFNIMGFSQNKNEFVFEVK